MQQVDATTLAPDQHDVSSPGALSGHACAKGHSLSLTARFMMLPRNEKSWRDWFRVTSDINASASIVGGTRDVLRIPQPALSSEMCGRFLSETLSRVPPGSSTARAISAAYGLDTILLNEYHKQIWRDTEALEGVVDALRDVLLCLPCDGGMNSNYILEMFASMCAVDVDIVQKCRLQLFFQRSNATASNSMDESTPLLYDLLRAIPMQREDVASAFAATLGVDVKMVLLCWRRLRLNCPKKSADTWTQTALTTAAQFCKPNENPSNRPGALTPERSLEKSRATPPSVDPGGETVAPSEINGEETDEGSRGRSKTVHDLESFLEAVQEYEPWLDDATSKMDHCSKILLTDAPELEAACRPSDVKECGDHHVLERK